jgi:hypothetical protein
MVNHQPDFPGNVQHLAGRGGAVDAPNDLPGMPF